MKRSTTLALALGLMLAAGATPGCNCSSDLPLGDGGLGDGGGGDGGTGGDGSAPNACGNHDPSCTVTCVGPECMPPVTFPLPSDDPPPDNVQADGVNRNPAGHIVLDSSKATFDFLWIANSEDWNVGTVSKIDTKPRANVPAGAINGAYREVARYLTVTCRSDPNPANWGTPATPIGTGVGTCDGTVGCCTRAPDTQKVPVQLVANSPSRTAVDFNGDVWIANRAHVNASFLRSSVTKIANRNNSFTDTDCIDRNGNGKIDTSHDANGDGIINTDCNADGVLDDLSVEAACASAGRPLEFFGLDDECVLFTTHTGPAGGIGRPLALGPSNIDPNGPSDAYAGHYNNGTFFRIDGKTGLVKDTIVIAAQNGKTPNPYGAVVDQFGILWAPNLVSYDLFYVDTNNKTSQGVVSAPGSPGGTGFYGIAIDGYEETPQGGTAPQLVQQIWLGHWGKTGAFRYRPNRGASFAGLGLGTWAQIDITGSGGNGRGIGVDNRKPTAFAWLGLDSGNVFRIPTDLGSSTMNTTHTLAAAVGTNIAATGGPETIGTGVAADLDVWGINRTGDSASHFRVDAAGNIMNAASPDIVTLNDNVLLPQNAQNHPAPRPYTYSDFTGFGLRNFTNPRGTYTWRETGCGPDRTRWLRVEWEGDEPAGTNIQVRVRSANDVPGLSQAQSFGNWDTSPADLQQAPGPIMPNPSGFLEVEFILTTQDKSATPALKAFKIVYECVNAIG